MTASSVSSTPVDVPAGIRVTFGHFDCNGAGSGGAVAVTAAQFGGGSNGIPARMPDFVIFSAGSAADDDDTDAATVFVYSKSAKTVTVYGSEPLVDEAGLGIDDGTPNSSADYLAVWVTPNPAGITTA